MFPSSLAAPALPSSPSFGLVWSKLRYVCKELLYMSFNKYLKIFNDFLVVCCRFWWGFTLFIVTSLQLNSQFNKCFFTNWKLQPFWFIMPRKSFKQHTFNMKIIYYCLTDRKHAAFMLLSSRVSKENVFYLFTFLLHVNITLACKDILFLPDQRHQVDKFLQTCQEVDQVDKEDQV